MSTSLRLTIPEDLKETLDSLAAEADISMAGVFRRTLGLYVASQQGKAEGQGIGLFDLKTKEVTTEFVGL